MFCTPSHFTPDTRPYFSDSVCKYGSVLMHTKVGDISWARNLSGNSNRLVNIDR